MLFRFDGRCADCGHEWEGLRRRIVCGPIEFHEPETCWCHSCARCFVELSVPRQLSRSSWLRWVTQNASELTRSPLSFAACELGVRVDLQSLEVISRSPLLFLACERVSSVLCRVRSRYVAAPIDIGTIECPDCRDPMTLGDPDRVPLVCPECEHPSAESVSEQYAGTVLVDYWPLAEEDVRRVILHLEELAEPFQGRLRKSVLALPAAEVMGPLWDRHVDS